MYELVASHDLASSLMLVRMFPDAMDQWRIYAVVAYAEVQPDLTWRCQIRLFNLSAMTPEVMQMWAEIMGVDFPYTLGAWIYDLCQVGKGAILHTSDWSRRDHALRECRSQLDDYNQVPHRISGMLRDYPDIRDGALNYQYWNVG
jgi:hypothetical protein